MLRVCQLLASIVQYAERNLLLLAVFPLEIYRCVNKILFSSLLFGVFTDVWRSLP